MAKYLMTVGSSGPLTALKDHPVPLGYLLECKGETGSGADDGLEHWTVDLELAGSLADWMKAPAYDALWAYFQGVAQSLEMRPRVALRVHSRFDPHSISVEIAYLGDHELKRAAEAVRQRLDAVLEPKSKKMKADVSLTF